MLRAGRSRVQRTNEIIEMFNLLNPSSRNMALASAQTQTEVSTVTLRSHSHRHLRVTILESV
jgi:hypothetical protein